MSIADPPAPAPTGGGRAAEILALLTAGDRRAPLIERVCQIGARVLGVTGAGMWLIGGADPRIFVHGSDPLSTDLESMQVILGEGPGIYAVRAGVPVIVPALAERRVSSWQTYADRALARGVRAVFSFPLRAGSVQLGSLDLYRTQPGPLGATRTADAGRSPRSRPTRSCRVRTPGTSTGRSVPGTGSRPGGDTS